nr:MAG: hypothetical protein DIU64_10890 [Caldicoprobacter oshimai]
MAVTDFGAVVACSRLVRRAIESNRQFGDITQEAHLSGCIDETASEELLKDFFGSKVREFTFNRAVDKFFYNTLMFVRQLLVRL